MAALEVEISACKWWLNPFKFLDYSDILEDRESARRFFYDTMVQRPTELRALLRLYLIAANNLDERVIHLTRRQSQVIGLAREAMKQGVHPTRYVSSHLKISNRAVQRLMNRAGRRIEEMFAFEQELPVVDVSNKQNTWYPAESQIKQQIARTERICAGCGIIMHTGRYALCWECGERFGHTREEWSQSKRPGEPAPARWLLPEARRLDREVRQEAINELFRAKDFEEVLEQYQQAS